MSVQLRDRLLELFQSRGLRPGDRLPSEAEIAELFVVGRSTAREALKLLEQEGLVSVTRGSGRFLSSLGTLAVERPITRFESVSTMLEALGIAAKTTVLSVAEVLPTTAEAEALGVAESEPVIRLERLRFNGDDPLIYSIDTVPRRCIDGPIKHLNWTGSLNDLLSAQGFTPVSSAARLRAVDLPQDVQQRYSLSNLGPWLLICETVISNDGSHILYAEDYHRGDMFTFNVLRR
jgi:GntR family transcriptional regulator